MKTKLIFILLSCFFSSILYAETITVISTPPTINGVQGTPTENTLTRAKGKVINITAKPKEGFQGVIKIDGVVVSTSEVNSAVRYKYTITKDARVEISYKNSTDTSVDIESSLIDRLGNKITITLPNVYTDSDVVIIEGVNLGEHPETYKFLTNRWIEITLPKEQINRQLIKVKPNGQFNSVMKADEAEEVIILTPFLINKETGNVEFKVSPTNGKITFSLIQINE